MNNSMNMTARITTKEEHKRVDELFSYSFTAPMDGDISQPIEEDDVRYGAFTDEGEMTSCVFVPEYKMYFDENEVAMAGIGGVSTLPKYRGNGGIRKIFELLLPDIYKRGFVFSYLYPFSTDFYRKFGYETGVLVKHLAVNTMSLPKDGDVIRTFLVEETNKEASLKIIEKTDRVWQKRFNGQVTDDNKRFKEIINGNPLKEKKYTYIYDGEESGFMTLCCKEDGAINVSKIEYTGIASLKALLSIIRSYGSDWHKCEFTIPVSENIENLISEKSFGNITTEIFNYGMVRVVNVYEALKLAHYIGDGEVIIKTEDDYINENNGIFRVIFKNGKAVSVKKDSEAIPYITMPINRFSAFLFGAYDVTSLKYFDDVLLNTGEEYLKSIFYKKNLFIDTYF